MHWIKALIRNPVKVAVGVLLVMLFGIIALWRMPIQLTPEIEIPTITVETRWPGASPHEVEREIVQEQERQLKGVEGVTKITSECMDSLGRIRLEFAVGTDMREALLKVNTHLQQVRQYPEDADEPVIRTASLSSRPIAWFILTPRLPKDADLRQFAAAHPHLADEVEHIRRAANEGVMLVRLEEAAARYPELRVLLPPAVDVTLLRKFAEDVIEARFERVPGVAEANILGGRDEEMHVIVDPQKLAARKLTILDVRHALRGQNKDTSGGDVWEGKRRYVLRTLGRYRRPEDVAQTVIGYQDGAPVYVCDVAEVRPGFHKPESIVRRFGARRLSINCIREIGANVLEVMDGLRAACRELNAGVLAQRGLQLVQVYDETEYIYAAIHLVRDNILLGSVLTVGVLLVFLKSGRSTLIIGLAIPTSIIGAFLVLSLMGRSLNVVSLAGMAFAVGMLVDNAIVVLENIYRHRQLGKSAWQAAVQGTTEVWGAVLSSTLTTLAVFLPVLFVREEAGQLFYDISLAISAGVGLSLVAALTVIPVSAPRLLAAGAVRSVPLGTTTPQDQGDGRTRIVPHDLEHTADTHDRPMWRTNRILATICRPLDKFGRAFSALIGHINDWLLQSVVYRSIVVALFVFGSLALCWLTAPHVEYLPSGNRNLVFANLQPPPGYNLDEMMRIAEEIEKRLRPYWDVDAGVVAPGTGVYPAISDYFLVARGRQMFVGVRSADPSRVGDLVPLMQQVTSGIPGVLAVAKQSSLFEQGLGAGRTIDIEITGPELPTLVQLGRQVLAQVRQLLPQAQVIPLPSLDLASPEIHVVAKREQAADMGLTTEELGYIVDALVDGAYATDYYVGSDRIDLRIVGQAELASRFEDLRSLPVAVPTGDIVPLGSLADIHIRSGPEQINHRERQRAITIQVSPPPSLALDEALQLIEEHIVAPLSASDDLEQGTYRINLSGTADKLRATWEALRFNFVLAILICYLLMAALFESWLYPFVVILSVPTGLAGGFLALALLNRFVLAPLDVITMLGFVIIVGTAVNNPILIVEQALIHMRQERKDLRRAVLESV